MHTRRSAIQGFTVVELLIVVALLAIIATIVMSGFRNYASFQQFNQAASDVDFLLKQTRLSARSAEFDESHGIKFTSNSMTTFVGTPYNASDPQNETVTYSLVTLDVDLSDGGDEILFAKLTGLPSATGTVTVVGTQFAATTTIEITDAGVIQ